MTHKDVVEGPQDQLYSWYCDQMAKILDSDTMEIEPNTATIEITDYEVLLGSDDDQQEEDTGFKDLMNRNNLISILAVQISKGCGSVVHVSQKQNLQTKTIWWSVTPMCTMSFGGDIKTIQSMGYDGSTGDSSSSLSRAAKSLEERGR